jgi:aryl-alcohol dehydrogenase-like predicted oxidoreductase
MSLAQQPDPVTRLGLGTVQFGLDYGITNANGKVGQAEAREILAEARRSGIDLLDTAALYGDSEQVIGEADPGHAFRIVTKTAKVGSAGDGETAARRVRERFDLSLRNLRAGSVDGLLVHDPADLTGPFGAEIWQELQSIRKRGLARRIGVSVYTGEEIDAILSRFEPDIVQLPINALDARLVRGGQLDRLAARGVEVHARSVFLQGLLLQSARDIPDRFVGLAERIGGLHEALNRAGLTPLEGALAAVLRLPAIARIIVGTTGVAELAAIVAAVRSVADRRFDVDFDRWTIEDERILNPARWGTL